jgi:hypothetical protein
MDAAESMKPELSQWNDGSGIDLETWIGFSGNFSLAVGYTTLFWPEFVEFDGYILRAGFTESILRDWENQPSITRKSIEHVMNHFHILDIHHSNGADDATKDKIIALGRILKEIYEAKLRWQFPDRPCVVDFYEPTDAEDWLLDYQISFWQVVHESV